MPARHHLAAVSRNKDHPSPSLWNKVTAKLHLSTCFTAIFVAYLGHSLYTIYQIYYPKPCPATEKCIQPSWNKNTRFDITAFVSTSKVMPTGSNLAAVWTEKSVDIALPRTLDANITLPRATTNNGTLYLHLFIADEKQTNRRYSLMSLAHYDYEKSAMKTTALTKFVIPLSKAFNLLESQSKSPNQGGSQKTKLVRPVTHWIPKISVHVMSEALPIHGISHEMIPFFQVNRKREYLPIIYMDHLGVLEKDFLPVNSSAAVMPLTLTFTPVTFGKMRLITIVDYSLKMLENAGFSEKDTDDVKAIFFDTNIYLLFLTFIVSGFHLLFDLLSFKNDISFWRSRTNNVGLSFRSLIWRCISQVIIFLYLYDQGTSLVVLVPAGVSIIIEIWKITKALKLKFVRVGWLFGIQFGTSSKEEQQSDAYDSEGMKYLFYIVSPCCVIYAIYSLLFIQHRSWFSWCIETVVNGVYAFGFVFMMPQLFVNYRLKSVAHLPWRAFMYKAFNTVVDDLFAFIITMPTAHRVACFRDDVVFLIYLYQRWLYPVDSSRQTEYSVQSTNDGDAKRLKDKKE